MENPIPAQGGGLGVSSQGAEGLNNNFKLVKQMQAATKPSLKTLAPAAKSVKEMGANFDMGSEIGMTKVNSAESTKIQAAPEIGRGGLVNEVF